MSSKNPAPDLKLSKFHLNKLTNILKEISFNVNLLKIKSFPSHKVINESINIKVQ